jgi:hypothetical protein
MARLNTCYGAYDVSLKDEIERILKGVQNLGIRNPNKLEVSALIAQKNRKAKMTKQEVVDFFERFRGIR